FHNEQADVPWGGPFLPVTPVTTATGEVILAELAVSDLERSRGLSGHQRLDPGRGLLAEYPEGATPLFPAATTVGGVDLVWLDASKGIIEIAEQLDGEDPVQGPADARWALVLPAGDAVRLDIAVGLTLEF